VSESFMEIGELKKIDPDCSKEEIDAMVRGLVPGPVMRFEMKFEDPVWPPSLFDGKLNADLESMVLRITQCVLLRRVGKLFIEFEGNAVGGGRKRFRIFFPVDRRQARRLARRLGKTFRWTGGKPAWREARKSFVY
jgi:hypothetical protein